MASKSDVVLDYILKNAAKLSPEKIEALSKVLAVTKDINEVTHEPNSLQEIETHEELMEEEPLDFTDVTGIEFEGKNKQVKTKIYRAYPAS